MGRLVHGDPKSGMSFVHSKLIYTWYLVEKGKVPNPYFKPPSKAFLTPK